MPAGFNIEAFRSQINARGIQKPNKFLVRFGVPSGLQSFVVGTPFLNALQTMEYWCEATHIPGMMVQLRQILRFGYGVQEKVPFAPTFNDISFTILSDGNAENWSFFQQWLKFILNYDMRAGIATRDSTTGASSPGVQDPFELSYKSEYAVNVDIICYDDSGVETYHIILREAFPIFVGDIPLNWADNNNLMRIPVSFAFTDWYNQNINLQSPPVPITP